MSALEVGEWVARRWPETCSRGHELNAANLYVPPDGRRWHCRPCRRSWQRMTPVAHRHLDFAPLDDASATVLAMRYRVSRRTIYRWRKAGVPWLHAEAVAQLLGLHPCELWSDFYEELAA